MKSLKTLEEILEEFEQFTGEKPNETTTELLAAICEMKRLTYKKSFEDGRISK